VVGQIVPPFADGAEAPVLGPMGRGSGPGTSGTAGLGTWASRAGAGSGRILLTEEFWLPARYLNFACGIRHAPAAPLASRRASPHNAEPTTKNYVYHNSQGLNRVQMYLLFRNYRIWQSWFFFGRLFALLKIAGGSGSSV
jgi:hypothetical protein